MFQKYKRTIIIFITVLVVLAVVFTLLFGLDPGSGFSRIIQTGNNLSDMAIILSLIVLVSLLFGSVFGYLTSPLYIFLHKLLFSGRVVYGIEDRDQSTEFKGVFLKALFPSLFAANFCIIYCLIPDVQTLLTNIASQAEWTSFIILLPFMTGISFAVFSPILFLLDTGIIYTNQEKVKNTTSSTEVRSIGSWYNYLLKGYAGISVIWNYMAFFITIIPTMILSGEIFGNLVALTLIPLFPLIITILVYPVFILLDMTRERRKSYVLKWAKRLGIKDSMNIIINKE